MQAKDVQVGHTYRYHATTGRVFDVRIKARCPLLGGWRAIDVSTGKPLLIRYATRLRHEIHVVRDRSPLPDCLIDQKKRAAGE